jgi:protein SCO1
MNGFSRFDGQMRVRASFIAACVALGACASEPLPVLGTLPAFALTDESGRPFGSTNLEGRVWVANFIFTRCPTLCPAFSAKMALVQKKSQGLGDRLHLVSFSVDPDYDTPARLAEFAQRYGAEPARWTFLTGPLARVKGLVTDGLKIAMGKRPDVDDDVAAIFHGTYFVLVDRQLQIRGYIDSSSATAVQEVVEGAAKLLNERP